MMTTTAAATKRSLRTVLSRIRTASSSSSSLPPCFGRAETSSLSQSLVLGGTRDSSGGNGWGAAETTTPRRRYNTFSSTSPSSCCSNNHLTMVHAQPPNQKGEQKPFSSAAVAAITDEEHEDDANNPNVDGRDGPVVVLTSQPGPKRISRPRSRRRTILNSSNKLRTQNEPTREVDITATDSTAAAAAATRITKTESTNLTENKKSSDDSDDEQDDLPPPLPQPKYSVYKRVLPSQLTAFSSVRGRRLLMEAIQSGFAEPYFRLTEQFMNQSDPAYCGVTTLLVCLNASSVDPNIRWKGGWRFYASEDVLLSGCCLSKERILREGIVMDVFARLAKCHGLHVDQKHAEPNTAASTGTEYPRLEGVTPASDYASNCHSYQSLDDFRQDCRSVLSDTSDRNPLLVVSFSRQALGQTGDGHFSPVAAYNDKTDEVLVLDVARFKYAPYWVPVEELYRAMQDVDTVSRRPRGWFILQPPHSHSLHIEEEDRRPVEVVPEVGQDNICPVNPIKVEFCQVNPKWREEE